MATKTALSALSSNPNLRYVARQPILDVEEQTFGYELLFRDGVENYFRSTDPDGASRNTLNTSMLMGLDLLCDTHWAFMNCTRDVLLKDYITLFPASQACVEILESVPVDDLVLAACRRLRAAGYILALDDFVADDPREPLVEFAEIIKVDLQGTTEERRADMVRRYRSRNVRMLAEKVETREQFVAAKQAGFSYFQGYFFQRPQVLQARDIPANRLNYLRLMQAISHDNIEPRQIEQIVKSEASLCYRLLRYLNSPVFGFYSEIQSIRHALAILGEREVRRWIRLVATLTVAQDKSNELVLSALVRARFCELLAPRLRHDESDLFLLGLLSLMDTILDLPMFSILEQIPVDRETKAVLLAQPSELSPLYELVLARESGQWEKTQLLSTQLGVPESFVAESFWKATEWANQANGAA